MINLTGKTAIITGASRGIGADTARVFADAGADVFLLARSAGAISQIADEIGPKATAITCDVSNYADVEKAVKAATDKTGRLDILINNAGLIEPITRMEDSDPDAWGEVIDVNLKGVFCGMRAALPVMQAQGEGTILTVSSGAAHGPLEGWSHYCSSKAAAAMLTRCAAKENEGLRIMGLSPGTVATEMQVQIKSSGINPVSQLDPSVHIPADWPAKALLWMCSPDADEFAGQEISLRDDDIRVRVGLS